MCSLLYRYIVVMQVFMLFMFFWTMNFVVAMGQMVLAGAFASYYWAFEKPKDIPAFPLSASLYRTFRSGSYIWYFVVPFTLFSCLWRSKLLSNAIQYHQIVTSYFDELYFKFFQIPLWIIGVWIFDHSHHPDDKSCSGISGP